MPMRLAIATPVYGEAHSASVALWYHEAVLRLKGSDILDMRAFINTDLVRARSRALYMAYEGGYDHLLFWDSDVQAPPDQIGVCIRAMIDSGFDVVGAPYPKKQINWKQIEHALCNGLAPTAENIRAVAYNWPVRDADLEHQEKNCAPCRYLPMGFTLISRAAMKTMIESPNNSHLRYRDVIDGKPCEVTAAFALVINSDGVLLSEDYSFCHRWTLSGGKCWLYVGEGSLLQHVGSHAFGAP